MFRWQPPIFCENALETCRRRKHWKSRKEGFLSRWKRQIVVNSMQARLRAQLGDRSEYSGERRRRSVVVASIVLTITDPLRGSYPLLCNLQAALIRSCGASFACMELTIISRFQRLIKNWFGLFLRFFFGCWWSKCLIFNSIITHCVKIW